VRYCTAIVDRPPAGGKGWSWFVAKSRGTVELREKRGRGRKY